MSGEADGSGTASGSPVSAIRIAISVVAVAAIALIFVLVTADADGGTTADSDLIGQVVPELEGTTLEGGSFDIDNERGRWVVVNFFASWCIPCEQEHPELVAFAEGNADKAIVVSVPFGDTEEGARAFFDEFGGDWPVVLDPDAAIAVGFAVRRPPESYLVGPSGLVAQKWVGQVTAEWLEDTIAAYEEAARES